MLDFRPNKSSASPRFTLDRAEQARMTGRLRRVPRGLWHALFLLFMGGIIIWLGLDWGRQGPPGAAKRIAQEQVALPMTRPALEGLAGMPTEADITGQTAAITEALDQGTPPIWSGDNDPALLAWARTIGARDQANPPMPQGVEVKDLVLRHIRIGSPIMISGQLLESAAAPLADGSPGWQRLIVMPEPDQYLLLLAPPSKGHLVIGDGVQAVGRFVGFINLPCQQAVGSKEKAGAVEVPFLIARRVNPVGAMNDGETPFWRAEGMFTVPPDIYAQVDDERLVLETRPYYYTLGQVAREAATPDVLANPGNLNQVANEVHQKPDDFRGQPFTVRGKVFNAWVDPAAGRDQPFGVQRVVRIIFWSEDWSKISLSGQGQPVDKLVARVFEIAAVSDRPLPAVGTAITATGRFMRLRAMEVKPDKRREEASAFTRQSDRSYTFFLVTNGWTELPPEAPAYTWTWVNNVILGLVLVGTAGLLWLVRRNGKREGLVQESIRRLRATRHQLKTAPGPNASPDHALPPTQDPPPPA